MLHYGAVLLVSEFLSQFRNSLHCRYKMFHSTMSCLNHTVLSFKANALQSNYTHRWKEEEEVDKHNTISMVIP